jgi:uncharacterized membrane protein
MDSGKSALGLDGNLAAALGYPIGIIAIISLIMEKENRFVKFHALQSILLHAVFVVCAIVLVIILVIFTIVGAAASVASTAAGSSVGALGGMFSGIIGLLLFLVYMVMIVVYLVALIMTAVKAYQNQWYKIPVIGNMADKWIK